MLTRSEERTSGSAKHYLHTKVNPWWTPAFHGGGWAGYRNAFNEFVNYMGTKPSGCELDRIDSAGNYEPGNVQWLTKEDHRFKTKGGDLNVLTEARDAAERDLFPAKVVDRGMKLRREKK
jgi:hypothetical protein